MDWANAGYLMIGVLLGWIGTRMAHVDSEAKAWDSGFHHGSEHGKRQAKSSYLKTLWECSELERIARLR